MVCLRVVAVYLLTRFADLLDYEEVGVGLDDPFDLRLLVSGDDDEVVALLNDCCVAAWSNLDRLETSSRSALTVKRQETGNGMLLGPFLNPLVHIAEDLLVARGSFSEVHCRDDPLARAVGVGGRQVDCAPFAEGSGLRRGRSCVVRRAAAQRPSGG